MRFGSTIEIDINEISQQEKKFVSRDHSNAYLESNNKGDFTWQIEGVADVENVEGGCASSDKPTGSVVKLLQF